MKWIKEDTALRFRSFVVFLALALSLAAGDCLQAAETAPPAAKEGVALDFKDVELRDFIETISELTGRNFVYDDDLKGKVTIVTPERISLDEAYRVFLTVLNMKGFTVVPTGKVFKVAATRDAKELGLPTITEPQSRLGEQYVTQIIPLDHLDANVVATTILKPLIPKTGYVAAYEPTNSLIITDSAANIARLYRIIRELDIRPPDDLIEVFNLQYAPAEELATVIRQYLLSLEGQASPVRRARRPAAAAAPGDTQLVIPYPRTNVLIVATAQERIQAVRDLIVRLDQRQPNTRSNISVYYLENADAETLAKTLNEIVTGAKVQQQAQQARRGAKQPAQQGQEAPLATPVSITADKSTNSLIINATPEDFDLLKGIIQQLDIVRKQVFVEALVLELSLEATKSLGVSLQGGAAAGGDGITFGTSNLNTGNVSLGDLAPAGDTQTPSLLTRTIQGIVLGGLFNPITTKGPDGQTITVPALSALIDLSQANTDVNVVSAPRILTTDNEEAEIIVGSNVPIVTGRSTTDGGTRDVIVERQDVALTLRITPQITEGGLVRLDVYQEITEVAPNAVGNVDEVGPTLTKRLLRNTALAENGKTVVLGGLISTNRQNRVSKVPLLGDLPLLGWLFRSRSDSERKTNLLVFITPTIIKDPRDLALVTTRSRRVMEEARSEFGEVHGALEPLKELSPATEMPAERELP